MPRYYPLMLEIKGEICLVVGGGKVAVRKVKMLLKCGATVRVVALRVEASLKELMKSGNLECVTGPYEKRHLKDATLVFAATNDNSVNRAISRDAREYGIPVNVADAPELCSFVVPSIVERGDLVVAISTSGKSPALAKQIRMELEQSFGPEYARMLELLGKIRQLLIKMEPNISKRKKVLSRIVDSDLLERIRTGENPKPEDVIGEGF